MNYTLMPILTTLIILTFWVTEAKSEIVNKILAHVGSKVITEYDVQNLDPLNYNKILAIDDENIRNQQLETYNEVALNYLIDQETVIIAAERENIKVSDNEVEMALNDIMATNKIDLKTLEKELEKEGTSLVKYKYKLKIDILNARVRNQVLMPKIVVTEKDIKDMVDRKGSQYNLKERYEISVLMTADKNNMNKALKEIKNSNFENAVKKYSIDKSAVNNGYMGLMDSDTINPEMLKAVKKVGIGEITKPVKINNLWIICRVENYQDKYTFDEETRNKIVEDVSNELFQNIFKNWLERNKSTIVIIRQGDY